jgi:catechol 2,3-dioxygenase-like lactoylglutathione lyase family enzyme
VNLWRIENDEARLSLHEGQAAAWNSKRRFVFVLAGTQGGKTSFGPWWLWNELKERGQGDYLAVTSSFDLFKLKMLPELRSVFENVLGIGRYWSGDKILELRDSTTGKFWAKRADDPMWGRIILRSAQSSGGLESATAKAAWLDECGQDGFTLEDWEAVQRRLSLSQGRVLGTTTIYNLGWLKSEIYDRWRDGDPDIDLVSFPSYINPAFPKAEFDRMEKKLPDWRFDMFYKGQFTRPAGLIYNAFTDEMLVDPFSIPQDWERAVGVDFGGANTAIVWLANEPESGRWYLYKEYLAGGRTTQEHVENAVRGLDGAEDFYTAGGAKSETQERLDWTAAGLPLAEPRFASVEVGIDRVTSLIKEDRFRLFKSCAGVRDELGSYRRKLDDAGNPTDDIQDKRHFHRLDALRYIAAQIEQPNWLIF